MQFSVPDVPSPGAGEIRTGARVRPSTGASLGAMTRRVSRATPLAAAIAALLANGSALALSLGPIEVSSALGEPLRAELPLGVAPGERVTPDCFRLTTDASAGSRGGLPYEASVQLLGNGPARRLAITGRTPLREPLLDLVIAVDCAGAPRMERGYTLMLSPRSQPAQRAPSPTAATPSPTAATPSPTAAAAARPARAQAPAAVTRPDSPLRAGERYRVRPGDTLSTIAQRVSDRELSIWAQAEAIFAANPDAFIGADPNRLRAGAQLQIPQTTVGLARPATPPVRPDLAEITPQIAEPPALAFAVESPAPATTTVDAPAVAAPAMAAATVTAAARRAAETMGPPVPERLALSAAAPSTAGAQAAAVQADGPRGLRSWLAGILVGLGFISLGGLLGWTALRRRPSGGSPAAAADMETTVRATEARPGVRLAPPPTFHRDLAPQDGYTVEFTVSETTTQPSAATDTARPAIDDTPTDEVAVLRDTGDTTIEHRFQGFSDTEALDMQMAEAMAMLERDYTSRFQAATSLTDTTQLDATDTLHALPTDVTQSLEELRAQANEEVQEEAQEEAQQGTGHGTADVDTAEHTALLEPPPGRVGTG